MKAKSIQLFNLFDELNEQVNNVMHDAVISKKRNRLDVIDQGAKEAERITREIQDGRRWTRSDGRYYLP